MKNNKSLTIIISVAVLVFIGLVFSVYKIVSNKNDSFYAAGYVSLSDAESSNKVYFDEGTTYKNGYHDEIIFKNSDNEKTEVSKYSLVYFDNKSIEFLTDGVILDLNGLSNNLIPYYNIKSNYIIEYNADKYVIHSNEQDVILDNFIGRINDQKYVVAGNNIKLKLSSNEEYITGDYFELNFIDGDTVKIDGQEISLETISDNSYILVGDSIKIDLSKKAIFYNDEQKLELSEIIIDNDANIDISYEDVLTDNATSKTKKTDVNVINNTQTSSEETNSYNTITNTKYQVETVTNYKNIPYLELLSSYSGPSSITLDFNIIDDSKLITGPITVKYTSLDDEDGKVYSQTFAQSSSAYKFVASNLVSNSKYVVTVSASYMKNSNLFADYILFQRTIETKDIGIDLNREYLESDAITYNITSNSNATYDKAYLKVYDASGNLVATEEFNNNNANQLITISGLDSNTKYTAAVEDVTYGAVKNLGTAVTRTDTTLKYNPFKDANYENNPTATVNKKDNTFTMNIGSIDDKDNAIESITYEIVDKASGEVVKKVVKDYTDSVDVKFSEPITTKNEYYFKTIVTLNDNEKVMDYELLDSNTFSLNNEQMPTMNFVSSLVTTSVVNGTVKIYDPDNTLDLSQRLYIEYTSALGDTGTIDITASHDACTTDESTTTKCSNVSISGLNSNDIYTFKVIGYINLNSEEIEPGYDLIGTFKSTTAEAIEVNTDMEWQNLLPEGISDDDKAEALQTLMKELFEVKIGLSLDLTDENNVAVMNNMNHFVAYLYEGLDTSGTPIGHMTVDNKIADTYFDQTAIGGEKNTKTVTLEDFGLSFSDLQEAHLSNNTQISQTYTILLTNGTSGVNEVTFKPKTYSFTINQELLQFSNFESNLELNTIDNATACENDNTSSYCDDSLDDSTAVGIIVRPTFNLRSYAEKIDYIFYDITDSNNISKYEMTVDLDNTADIPSTTIMFADSSVNSDNFFRRGHTYYATMTVELNLDKDEDGTIELVYPVNLAGEVTPEVSNTIDVLKQEPRMIYYRYAADYSTDKTNNSMQIRYQIEDIDNSLRKSSSVYYNVNETEHIASTLTSKDCTSTDGFTCATLTNLNIGNEYEVYLRPFLLEKDEFDMTKTTKVAFNSYTFEDNLSSLAINQKISYASYETNLTKYNNLLEIVLDDTNATNNDINRVAAYDVTLKSGSYSINIGNIVRNSLTDNSIEIKMTYVTIDGVSSKSDSTLNNVAIYRSCFDDESQNCIYIDYSKLYNSSLTSDFAKNTKGKDILVTVNALYDSGKVAYNGDSSTPLNYYAFQVQYPNNYDGTKANDNSYLISVRTNLDDPATIYNASAISAAYTYNNSVKGSSKNYGFVDDNTPVKYLMTLNNSIIKDDTNNPRKSKDITYTYDNLGVTYAGTPITAKLLTTSIITPATAVNSEGKKQVGENSTFSYDEIHPSLVVAESVATIDGFKAKYTLTGNNDTDHGTSTFFEISKINDSGEITSTEIREVPNTYLSSGVINATLNNGKYTIADFDKKSKYYIDVYSVEYQNGITLDSSLYSYDYRTGTLEVYDNSISNVYLYYYVGFGGLESNSTYDIKAYAQKDSKSAKVYYEDAINGSPNYTDFELEVNTLSLDNSGVISGVNLNIDSATYKERTITLTYEINDVVGINNITNNLSYLKGDTYQNVDVTPQTIANEKECSFVIDNVCFVRSNSKPYSYTASYTFTVPTNDETFVYGTDYRVTTVINTTEDNTEGYQLNKNEAHIRTLENPTFVVERSSSLICTFDDTSKACNGITYNLAIIDDDKVISDGTFDYTLEYNDSNGVFSEVLNGTKVISGLKKTNMNVDDFIGDDNSNITYPHDNTYDLEQNSEYYLAVYYKLFINNLGASKITAEDSQEVNRYVNYTLTEEGVSEGKVEFKPKSEGLSELDFSYANGFEPVAEDGTNKSQAAQIVGIDYAVNGMDQEAGIETILGTVLFYDTYSSVCSGKCYIDTDALDKESNVYKVNLSEIKYEKYGVGYQLTYHFYLYYPYSEYRNTESICTNNGKNLVNKWDSTNNICLWRSNDETTPSSPVYGYLGVGE